MSLTKGVSGRFCREAGMPLCGPLLVDGSKRLRAWEVEVVGWSERVPEEGSSFALERKVL